MSSLIAQCITYFAFQIARRSLPYLVYDSAALHSASLYFAFFRLCILGCCLRPWDDYFRCILACLPFSLGLCFVAFLLELPLICIISSLVFLQPSSQFLSRALVALSRRVCCLILAFVLAYLFFCALFYFLPFLIWEVSPVLWRKNIDCVFGNRVLRTIRGPQKKRAIGWWRKSHNLELHALRSLHIFFEWLNKKIKRNGWNM
jgi:hypothetical protein